MAIVPAEIHKILEAKPNKSVRYLWENLGSNPPFSLSLLDIGSHCVALAAWSHYEDQEVLVHRDPSASASVVLGSQRASPYTGSNFSSNTFVLSFISTKVVCMTPSCYPSPPPQARTQLSNARPNTSRVENCKYIQWGGRVSKGIVGSPGIILPVWHQEQIGLEGFPVMFETSSQQTFWKGPDN